jgi:hypothetical protein
LVTGINRWSLLRGSEEPPEKPVLLRAGPLEVHLDGTDLRYLRSGGTELVRRVYAAVRDRNWNTIPGQVTNHTVEQAADSFQVDFDVAHESRDIDFSWHGTIVGTSEGELSFEVDGRTENGAVYNRIGLCVLHPWHEHAGRQYRGLTADGPISGVLPHLVGPQGFHNGGHVALFPPVSHLELQTTEGGWVELDFEGDTWETEDQRNWTDASFKTYCTPLGLPLPHRLDPGGQLRQRITISAHDLAPPVPPPPLRLVVGGPAGTRVPLIGLSLPETPEPSSGPGGLSDSEAALLRILHPDHIRVPLAMSDPSWPDRLEQALNTCLILGAALELTLFVRTDDAPALDALAAALAERPGATLARVLVAAADALTTTPEETTPPELVELVRGHLGSAVAIAGGTDMYFCELNRTRPQVDAMDGVFWSLNPQVHAFDDISLLETPEALAQQVVTARDFAPGLDVYVGPVTLKRRYNVNATTPEADGSGPDGLPEGVDPRQSALIGAAWTSASAGYLARAGADSVTWFETVGRRGVVPGDRLSPPGDIPISEIGDTANTGDTGAQVFPLFHVLADLAQMSGAQVLDCTSTRPLEVTGLAVAHGDKVVLMAANLTPELREVEIDGLPRRLSQRRLNEFTAEQATVDPSGFRGASEQLDRPGNLMLWLDAYETVRIEAIPDGETERRTT